MLRFQVRILLGVTILIAQNYKYFVAIQTAGVRVTYVAHDIEFLLPSFNFVLCIECEINKAKDYTFTLLAKVN